MKIEKILIIVGLLLTVFFSSCGSSSPFDESKIISNELSSLVETDYGIKLQVFSENDTEKYDPKNKARMARPYKPAILIE